MEPIRKLADVVIDTTKFNVHELRQFITRRFQKTDRRPMMVSMVSFGYRYGDLQPMRILFSDVQDFSPIPISCRNYANIRDAIRVWRATFARFHRQPIFCGALNDCWSI